MQVYQPQVFSGKHTIMYPTLWHALYFTQTIAYTLLQLKVNPSHHELVYPRAQNHSKLHIINHYNNIMLFYSLRCLTFKLLNELKIYILRDKLPHQLLYESHIVLLLLINRILRMLAKCLSILSLMKGYETERHPRDCSFFTRLMDTGHEHITSGPPPVTTFAKIIVLLLLLSRFSRVRLCATP